LESASSTGSTKQAESCPSGRPAFISVGEFGSKSRRVISSVELARQLLHLLLVAPYFASSRAITVATRQNISSGVLDRLPVEASFFRYACGKTAPKGAQPSTTKAPMRSPPDWKVVRQRARRSTRRARLASGTRKSARQPESGPRRA
jgi:hypothetical protein